MHNVSLEHYEYTITLYNIETKHFEHVKSSKLFSKMLILVNVSKLGS